MPIQINYIDNGIGVEFICSDVVTGQEIIEANKEIYKQENFINQKYQIIDRVNCIEYQVTNEEMQRIAEQDKAAAKINPNILVALISSSTLQYGMSRMYQAYIGDSGFRTEIFQDINKAKEWIKNNLTSH